MRSVVRTDTAPAAIGPYNQAIAVRGTLLFTAGQIALDPATGEMVGQSIEEQTEQVLKNLKAVVDAGGSRVEDVVKVTVFLTDMDHFLKVNEIYSRFFPGDNPPARSAVEVSRLPKDALVEMEAVALVHDD